MFEIFLFENAVVQYKKAKTIYIAKLQSLQLSLAETFDIIAFEIFLSGFSLWL